MVLPGGRGADASPEASVPHDGRATWPAGSGGSRLIARHLGRSGPGTPLADLCPDDLQGREGSRGLEGLKLLLCENPLPPTYALFPEIARRWTETPLGPGQAFAFDLARLEVPRGTTLVVIVNPNNPTGGTFDMTPLPDLLRRHPGTAFLVDEAFIDMGGQSVAPLVERHANLLVVRTLSKAHSLAGFRVGYAVLPPPLADDLNTQNDAYPLARPSQAAALATLAHDEKIRERVGSLRAWTEELAADLRALGIRTYPTETYFFLADLAPREAAPVAARLAERRILVKPLADPRLGPGFMRITAARPEDNRRFLRALGECL